MDRENVLEEMSDAIGRLESVRAAFAAERAAIDAREAEAVGDLAIEAENAKATARSVCLRRRCTVHGTRHQAVFVPGRVERELDGESVVRAFKRFLKRAAEEPALAVAVSEALSAIDRSYKRRRVAATVHIRKRSATTVHVAVILPHKAGVTCT